MTEAVIVAAARTPIGRARKGSLVGVDAFELAQIAVGRGHDRAQRRARRRHRRHRRGRVAPGWRRHRPLRGRRARPDRRPGPGRQPATAPPACRPSRSGRRRSRRAWTEWSSPAAPRARRPPADVDQAPRARRRPGAVDVAQPPGHARRPALRHDHHRGQQRRRRGRPHPSGRRRVGRLLPRSGHRVDRQRLVRRPDRAGHRRRRSTARPSSSSSTNIHAGASPSTPSPSSSPLHPEIEGFTVHRRQRRRHQRRRAAAVVVTADDYAAANGLTPLARIVSVGVGGHRARPHRHGAHPGHPEGPRVGPA